MRFWRKVKKVGACWEWQGSTNGRYGEIRLGKGHKVYAHRWIYERVWGTLSDDDVVMHTCDNTLCVRPAHLTAGTQYQNLHDAHDKGRMPQWRSVA